jgi:hypothetical protein
MNAILHKIFRVLMIAVIAVTSVGYTAVVGYCSMSGSTTCCCGSDHASPPSIPGTQTLAAEGFSCYTLTVVGGLHDTPALLSAAYAHDVIPAAVDMVPDGLLQLPGLADRPLFDAAPSDVHAPPGEGIYLKVSSLLI